MHRQYTAGGGRRECSGGPPRTEGTSGASNPLSLGDDDDGRLRVVSAPPLQADGSEGGRRRARGAGHKRAWVEAPAARRARSRGSPDGRPAGVRRASRLDRTGGHPR